MDLLSGKGRGKDGRHREVEIERLNECFHFGFYGMYVIPLAYEHDLSNLNGKSYVQYQSRIFTRVNSTRIGR